MSLFIKIGFAFFLAVVWVPFSKGQPAAPVLAQPPTLSRAPAVAPNLPPQNVNRPQFSAPKQPVSQSSVQRGVEKTNQPEQTTIVRIYRGRGYFDAALAEQLKPILARDFASTKNTNPVTTILNTLSGQKPLQPQWELPSASGTQSGSR